jgi:proteasome beta subunit
MTMPPSHQLPMGAPVPGSSFSDFLSSLGASPRWELPPGAPPVQAPEGTTVLAIRYQGGVAMAGDRRATEGHLIAHRYIRKVFPADGYSAVAIAGTAGLAVEMVKLFQVELEHYEKIEGHRLSLDGKANFLARLVRNHLPMAMQGLVVVPLFAGYDHLEATGRLYTYDVVGGRYDEQNYGATGSGARLAKSYLRTVFRDDLSRDDAVRSAVEALIAASEDDTATGGPDLLRGIYPTIYAIDEAGVTEAADEEIGALAAQAIEAGR